MGAEIVQAQYDQLETVARQFGRQADATAQMQQKITRAMQSLKQGWQGKGSQAFFAEMDGKVLPVAKRLQQALIQAQRETKAIQQIWKAAEEEAAQPFLAKEQAQVPVGQSSNGGGVLGFIGDLFGGAGAELGDMLKGIGNIIIHPIDTAKGLWYGVTHPAELWEGLKKPYVEDWQNGHPGRAIGRGIIFAGSFLIGAGEAGAAGKAGEAAGIAGKVAEVAGTTGKAAEVAEAANAVAHVSEVGGTTGRLGELGEAAGGAGRLGETGEAANTASRASKIFEGMEARPSQRALDAVPGPKLTSEVEQFVTVGKHGDINTLPLGTQGDGATKLLWTVDNQGAHFVPETLKWESSRGIPSHTNISDTAYFAGEAWRTGPNQITINSGSRAFGYNWQTAEALTGAEKVAYLEAMQLRYERAAQYFQELGLDVKVIPLGGR